MFIGHIQCPNSFVQLQETASPEESFLRLSETAVVHVQVLVDFTKRLPGEFLPSGNIRGTKSNWWHEPEKNTGFKQKRLWRDYLCCHEDNLEAFSSKLCYYCISSPFLAWSRDIFWKHVDLKIPPWGNYCLSTFSEIQLSMQFIIITKGKNRCSFKGKGSTEGAIQVFLFIFFFHKEQGNMQLNSLHFSVKLTK